VAAATAGRSAEDSDLIVAPETLKYDVNRFRLGNEAFLLLTKNGEFWALPVIDPASGIRSAALLYRADTGEAVKDAATLEWIATTDTSLSLPWVSCVGNEAGAATKLRSELESIVKVPMADHWADYRPARPEDFVGREVVQSSVFEFLDLVRTGKTETRLIALKGPSGWGKSSSLLKIASRARNVRNKGKYCFHRGFPSGNDETFSGIGSGKCHSRSSQNRFCFRADRYRIWWGLEFVLNSGNAAGCSGVAKA
jgi:hypothetical protein